MGLSSKLAAVKLDGFVLGIIAAAVLASMFPASGTSEDVLTWVTKISVALLFLLYGARLSPKEALDGVRHWRLHSVVLAATYILFPLIGLALRILVPTVLTDDLYTGVLYLCLVPSTIQSSIAFTSIAKGNVAGAVVSASLSNILGVFVTPLLVILLMNTSGQATVGASAVGDILLQLLLPFVVGQLLRPLVSGWLSRHSAPTKIVDRGSILLIVYSAFSASMNEHVWSSESVWHVVAVVVVCGVLLAIILGAHRADRSGAEVRPRGSHRRAVLRIEEESGQWAADGVGAVRGSAGGPDRAAAAHLSPDPADRLRGSRRAVREIVPIVTLTP